MEQRKLSQNRAHKFVNDIGIYAVGNIGAKLITFLMMPLYTYFIERPADYGYYDICLQAVFLLMPFVTLQMREGAFRFLLDADNDDTRSSIVTFVSRALATTITISIIATLLLSITTSIGYLWYTLGLLIVMSVHEVMSQVTRGLGGNKHFVASSIISAFGIGVFSLLFVAAMKLGIKGIFLANIVARIPAIIYLECTTHIFGRYFKFGGNYKTIGRELLRYALPLLPGALFWWLLTSSDRWFIIHFLGLDQNGIYAVAIRFTGVMMTLSNIFYQAWQETAILQYHSPDRDRFFSKIFNNYIFVLAAVTTIYSFTLKMCYSWLVESNYQESLLYIYPLAISLSMFALAVYFDIGYQCAKDTARILPNVILTAVINLILNFLLVPQIGLWGIVATAIISYAFMLVYRWFDCRRYMQLRFNLRSLLPILIVLIGIIPFYFLQSWWQSMCYMLIVLVALAISAPRELTIEIQHKIALKLAPHHNKKQ